MNYILFDGDARQMLLPLTFTRPVADVRIGIFTIREKWEKFLETTTSTHTEKYLKKKYPIKKENENLLIYGALLPNKQILDELKLLKPMQGLYFNDVLLAVNLHKDLIENFANEKFDKINSKSDVILITRPWHIFQYNDKAIKADFEIITKGRNSKSLSITNTVLDEKNIFIEEGAIVECAILNAKNGPIYIGKNAEVMEGSIIRGSFALCDNSAIKMGTKIYGATTIGPYSKVGGEISNSVIFGYSNKAHDGFLGNSVLGEWCNLGADTNNSNLKNNYSNVKLWDYNSKSYMNTGLQFCGLIMGDHAKSGINTMFNTGTVVGVCANVFGAGFPEKHIPSFAWGGAEGFVKYRLADALETAARVYERRGIKFTEIESSIIKTICELDSI